jgi:molybdopterin molybdotransferase
MRPGYPAAFGVIGATPVLALPGNPVAAFVAFHVLARPAIARMLGQSPELPPTIPVRLKHAVAHRGEQPTYLRARLCMTPTGWEADTAMDQAVGNMLSLSEADGLVVIPADILRIGEGEIVQGIRLDD